MSTEQETAWSGQFGTDYAKRNENAKVGGEFGNALLWQQIMRSLRGPDGNPTIRNAIEFGAGTGQAMIALSKIARDVHCTAVEINRDAIAELPPWIERYEASVLDWQPADASRKWDLVYTKGLLIHVHPAHLPTAYATIYRSARTHIMLAEYYSPRHESLPYRGSTKLLWKGDFAGDMLDRYQDLHLVDYGFIYHRDQCPQDDLTWFLLRKD